MKSFFIVAVILFAKSISINAQQVTTIIGVIKDTSNLQRLDGSIISLINTKDSSLFSFVRTDTSGNFRFTKVPKRKYKLSATHTGFHPYWLSFNVIGQSVIHLGEIFMRDNSLLDEIVVDGEKPPVTVNGDTLEFNARSFATKPNTVL